MFFFDISEHNMEGLLLVLLNMPLAIELVRVSRFGVGVLLE